MHIYTTEQPRERKELTDAIVAHLRIINDDSNDLRELERRTSAIVSNLRAINEDMRPTGESDREERTRH
jgi:hypothetical protein